MKSSFSQIQTKKPFKLFSSSGMRGGKFISVNDVSGQEHASSKNRHILNFRVMVVRDIKLYESAYRKLILILGLKVFLKVRVLGKVLI